MMTVRRGPALTVILAVVVATGCSGAAVATPPGQPTVAPPPSQAVATLPPLATTANTERNGVRVTLVLDRNPMPAGERTWATVTIRNTTTSTVRWMTDGCAQPAMVIGALGGDWVGGAGQVGLAERFKSFALEPLGHAGNGYLLIGFVSEQRLGRDVGCADVGLVHELHAAETLVHRAVWEGTLGDLAAPDGPVTVLASFPMLADAEGAEIDAVEVRLESRIVGGTAFAFLTPAAAIDAALADPIYAAWLVKAPESTWINSTHTLDPDAGTWQIGLFRESAAGFFGMVTLDARTGEVLDHRFE